MSNVSIYDKNWIDLVFENRNKEYGAYKLRQENARTTLTAFLLGISLFFSVLGLGFLVSSFDSKPVTAPIEPIDRTIITVNLSSRPETKSGKPKTTIENKTVTKQTNLSNMVVAPTDEIKVYVPRNQTVQNSQVTTGSETGTNTDSSSNNGNGTAATGNITAGIEEKKPSLTLELDKLPEFPGGIKKFYQYVGESIEKQEVSDSYNTISVYISFVIEKDGTMTNIKVLKSTDDNLEREAVRVLKALKTKWSPGIKDGEPVRTIYTLPIKVTL